MRFLIVALVVFLAFAFLAGCAPMPTAPAVIPEPRIEYRTVSVPTPVPCFTEAERPKVPEPTPIDLDRATTDQLAAALAADHAADDLYMRAVEALFLKCQAAAGKPVAEVQPPTKGPK